MIQRLCALIVASALLVCPQSPAQSNNPALAPSQLPIGSGIYDPQLDARVESLLKKMTLAEKVGQLVQ